MVTWIKIFLTTSTGTVPNFLLTKVLDKASAFKFLHILDFTPSLGNLRPCTKWVLYARLLICLVSCWVSKSKARNWAYFWPLVFGGVEWDFQSPKLQPRWRTIGTFGDNKFDHHRFCERWLSRKLICFLVSETSFGFLGLGTWHGLPHPRWFQEDLSRNRKNNNMGAIVRTCN